nr:depupylase/deamidase Dop [Rarobacter faecitabidus]
MGIETEYGILKLGDAYANPMLMSSQIVLAYRDLARMRRGTRWDYVDESPLRDARGFELSRASAHPSLLTDDPARPAPSGETGGDAVKTAASPVPDYGLRVVDEVRPEREPYDDPGAANVVLTNGARLYVDHAHPEYSSPEVTNPRDAVLWDRAGELVMAAGAVEASRLTGTEMVVYKNNVDGKGASYGTHENYLVDREVPFEDIVAALTTFFVTRNILIGSGRVGLGPRGEEAGFQISQRADYMEAEVGLETTMRRPIINTRDEPHADRDRWRRLHVIIGDANTFDFATYLKLGATACVLWAIELSQEYPDFQTRLTSLRLADPVADVQRVSRDVSLSATLALSDGRRLTAAQIQYEYISVVRDLYSRVGEPDPESEALLAAWSETLDGLVQDPYSVAHRVEWVAKLQVLSRLKEREHLDWDSPRLAAVDLQWSDMREGRGISAKLRQAGAVATLTDPAEVRRAVAEPPEDTRAYFRGRVLTKFSESVVTASWDTMTLDVPELPALSRIPMLDPARGTKDLIGALIEEAATIGDLVRTLAR